jgi:excisionase family DNA binding protein
MTTTRQRRNGERTPPQQFLTMAEVAAMYRVDRQTIRRFIADGDLPAFRIGKAIRIRRQDVEKLLVPITG